MASCECDGRHYRVRHHELPTSELTQHDTLYSSMQHHTVCTDSTDRAVASHNYVGDIGEDKDCRLDMNASNTDDGSSVKNMVQSCENQTTITEEPLTALGNYGTTISSSNMSPCPMSPKTSSAVKVRQNLTSSQYGLETSTNLDSITVILHIIFSEVIFCYCKTDCRLSATFVHPTQPGEIFGTVSNTITD